jgi:hypothetical protein
MTGQLWQDNSRDRTSGTGECNHDSTAGTGHLGQDSGAGHSRLADQLRQDGQNMVGKDGWDRTAIRGQIGHGSQDNWTAWTG